MALLDPIGNFFKKSSNCLIISGIVLIIFNLSFHTDSIGWFIANFISFALNYFFVMLGIFLIMWGGCLKMEE